MNEYSKVLKQINDLLTYKNSNDLSYSNGWRDGLEALKGWVEEKLEGSKPGTFTHKWYGPKEDN